MPDTSNPLPYANVQSNRGWTLKRNIIHWYVPQIGIIKMYINPQAINFTDTKIITQEKTKGGYSISYFGEELTNIQITGNTGSSGIEGINVLHEIYRAEQYLFDQNATLINSVNNQSPVSTMTSYLGQQLGGNVGGDIANAVNNISGINDPMNMTQLNPRTMTTLADIAFGVELYYSGWIYRGYFKNMTISETAEFLIGYTISFIATGKRGYRTNIHPFQHSPDGPSNYDSSYSYDRRQTINSNVFGNTNVNNLVR